MITQAKAAADKVYVYLADEDHQDVSVSPQPTFRLEPGASDDTHGVPVALHYKPEDLRFWVTYFDGGGFHRWRLGCRRRFRPGVATADSGIPT